MVVAVAAEVTYPTAHQLLEHCDAVLRLPGDSAAADQDVAVARRRRRPVYYRFDDIPSRPDATPASS